VVSGAALETVELATELLELVKELLELATELLELAVTELALLTELIVVGGGVELPPPPPPQAARIELRAIRLKYLVGVEFGILLFGIGASSVRCACVRAAVINRRRLLDNAYPINRNLPFTSCV